MFYDVLVYLVPLLLKTSVASWAVAIQKNRIKRLNIKFPIWLLVHTKDFESEMTLGEACHTLNLSLFVRVHWFVQHSALSVRIGLGSTHWCCVHANPGRR